MGGHNMLFANIVETIASFLDIFNFLLANFQIQIGRFKQFDFQHLKPLIL